MAYLQGFGPEGDHLRDRFNTQWASATEIAWGNRKLDPPSNTAWVRFNVRHPGTGNSPASVGTNPVHRHSGTVVIEVFVPMNDGEGAIDDYCDTAAGIFRDYRSQQGLRFDTPTVVNVGPTGDGWYKKDVLCPFVRDTVFS